MSVNLKKTEGDALLAALNALQGKEIAVGSSLPKYPKKGVIKSAGLTGDPKTPQLVLVIDKKEEPIALNDIASLTFDTDGATLDLLFRRGLSSKTVVTVRDADAKSSIGIALEFDVPLWEAEYDADMGKNKIDVSFKVFNPTKLDWNKPAQIIASLGKVTDLLTFNEWAKDARSYVLGSFVVGADGKPAPVIINALEMADTTVTTFFRAGRSDEDGVVEFDLRWRNRKKWLPAGNITLRDNGATFVSVEFKGVFDLATDVKKNVDIEPKLFPTPFAKLKITVEPFAIGGLRQGILQVRQLRTTEILRTNDRTIPLPQFFYRLKDDQKGWDILSTRILIEELPRTNLAVVGKILEREIDFSSIDLMPKSAKEIGELLTDPNVFIYREGFEMFKDLQKRKAALEVRLALFDAAINTAVAEQKRLAEKNLYGSLRPVSVGELAAVERTEKRFAAFQKRGQELADQRDAEVTEYENFLLGLTLPAPIVISLPPCCCGH